MSNKARNTLGKFAPKSEVPRKVRSVNLTDDAWQWLADVAAQAGVSRNDYIEAMAEGSIPLMETAAPEISPIMEMVEFYNAEIIEQPKNNDLPSMETVGHEVLPIMEMVEFYNAEIAEQPEDNDFPFMETVNSEVELLKRRLEDVEGQLKELQENPETDFDFAGKAGELVSWLRKIVGKALPKQVTVKEVQKILEGRDN